jgi:spermidine/putrescine transport system permease protein
MSASLPRIADLLWQALIAAVILFMVTPLVLVVLFAFAANEIQTFPIEGFTLKWFADLAGWPAFWVALENSAIVTGTVGLMSTIIGTLAAMALSQMRPARAGLVMTVLSLPVSLPPLVIGLALLSFLHLLKLRLGLQTVFPSHLIFTQPFVMLIVYARLASFDRALLEASRDLGASRLKACLTITLPMAAPSIIGAALIAMAVSLDDFVITFFTIGGGNTLPTLIWGMLRKSVTPSVNALGTLVLLFTIGASMLALRISRYRG